MGGQDGGSSLQDKTQAFLSEFFATGEVLVRELIEENERLKSRLAGAGAQAEGEADPWPRQIASTLLAKIDRLESECNEIRRIAGSVRQASGSYRSRLDRLEREHYHLASIHVAGNQFHLATTLEEVFRTITEILLNFVGVGSFTLYCIDEQENLLFPVLREGQGESDLPPAEDLPLSEVGTLPALGSAPGPWRSHDPMVTLPGAIMLLPLVGRSRMVGLARLERFLPQKAAFEEQDHTLLELISEHAGIGIETAWLRANATAVPMTRGPVEDLVRT